MFTDWWEVLRHFQQEDVAQAFLEWIRLETRAPKPADIRNLTVAAVKQKIERERHLSLAAPQRAAIPAPTSEENAAALEERRRRAEEIMARFARSNRVASAVAAEAPSGARPAYLDPESPAHDLARRAMLPKEDAL